MNEDRDRASKFFDIHSLVDLEKVYKKAVSQANEEIEISKPYSMFELVNLSRFKAVNNLQEWGVI